MRAAVLLAAGAAVYLGALAHYGLHLGEDGDVVYLIWRTADGQRPYVDFASGYTPGFFHLNAALLRLFGPDLLVLRWALVAVHAAAAAGLYLLARPLLPAVLAAAAPLAYLALMPVFPGEFATFNIPYPAWYLVPLWAASTLALMRGVRDRGSAWIAVAGLLAGIGCAIKPNTGAFNLAALALLLLFSGRPRGGVLPRLLWWGLLAGVLGCLSALFGFHLGGRDARLLLWPVFALAVVAALPPRAGQGTEPAGDAWRAGDALALLAGFAAVTVPWVLAALRDLGWQGFLRDVLFIGTGHELFFYLAIRPLDLWDAALVAAMLAAVATARLVRAGRLPAVPLVAAAAAAAAAGLALVVLVAPMPEGFHRALSVRLQHVAYGAAILAHWAGVAALARRRRPIPDPLLPIAVGAPLLFLSIYPRSDYFHWMLSAPLTLILGLWLVWRAVEPIATAALGRRWRAALVAAPAYALVAFLLYPSLALAVRLHAPGADLARLRLERAPIFLEAGRRPRLDDLASLVEHIRAHSAEGETLLGFPNLHLVNFLSDRHTPTRYGSFHPGWPDHEIEASIVAALEERRTPLIAVNHDQQLFMGHAPLYYFLLRAHLLRHYEHSAAFGSYDVFSRRGEGEPGGAGAAPGERDDDAAVAAPASAATCATAMAASEQRLPESAAALAACWSVSIPDREQERAVALARNSRDPAGGVPLARALAESQLGPRSTRLAVRVLAEIADARAFPAMVAARETLDGPARDEFDTALFSVASRAFIAAWLPRPRHVGEAALRADPALAAVAATWVADPDPRLRFAGAWLASVTGSRDAIPGLRAMLAGGDVTAQSIAATALIRLDAPGGVGETLVAALAHDEMFTPAPLLAWLEAGGPEAREVVAAAFRDGNDKQRETIAYIAAALDDPELTEVVITADDDPAPRVRHAARFAQAAATRAAAAAGRHEQPPTHTEEHP